MQSVTETAEKLTASKSSVSTIARLMVNNRLIEQVASPVPRRDYHRFIESGSILFMHQWLALMRELYKITERELSLMEEKPEELKERLGEERQKQAV